MSHMIDTPENTEIVYVFINKFEWMLSNDKEMSLGHPVIGRLYRAVYNRDTDSYRIVYKFGKRHQAVYVDKLQNADETKGYTADISLIKLSNILDFEINQEDLDSFDSWLETDNKELVEEIWGTKQVSQQIQIQPISESQIANVFAQFLSKTDPTLTDLIEQLHKLRNSNPQIIDALSVLTEFLVNDRHSDSPIDSYWLHLDKTHGTGANISAAVEKLTRYTGPDRRTNMIEADLLGAIKNLLMEQIRRDLYEEPS